MTFADELQERLDTIRQQGLFRQLRRVESPQSPIIDSGGSSFLNFSSNDYLGLANHPVLKEAAVEATRRYGTGAGASRLICGSLAPHHELEEALAKFKGCEAALAFGSGYAAATGTIGALLGSNDIIIVDKLVHACIVDAARLSGAKIRVYRHNDVADLERILKWADQFRSNTDHRQKRPRILIATESVFSMDGDSPSLREIVALKERYGAWLMLDEAHATGVFGPTRRGLAELAGVAAQVEIQMGTMGKALGTAGGYICGSRALIDLLLNRARSFVFSTAPPPATAAAATAAVHLVQSAAGEQRCHELWQRVEEWKKAQPSTTVNSPVIPIHIGSEECALQAADALRSRGIFVPAIRYPTVPRGGARLRVTLSAAHTSADLQQLMTTLASVGLPRPQPL